VRHGRKTRKLGRTHAHRTALYRNLVRSLLLHERIRTTLCKAKEARRLAERLVRFGLLNSLSARREVRRVVSDPGLVKKLFDIIAPRFRDRPGGSTRIYRLGQRESDGAEMAILELVVREETHKEKESRAKAGPQKKEKKKEKKPAGSKPKKAGRDAKKQ